MNAHRAGDFIKVERLQERPIALGTGHKKNSDRRHMAAGLQGEWNAAQRVGNSRESSCRIRKRDVNPLGNHWSLLKYIDRPGMTISPEVAGKRWFSKDIWLPALNSECDSRKKGIVSS